MGQVETCPTCSLSFVVDELDNDVARGISQDYGDCEACRREELLKTISKLSQNFVACGSAALFLAMLAARMHFNRAQNTPYEAVYWLLGIAAACAAAAVYYLARSRKPKGEVMKLYESEVRQRETAEQQRQRLLKELGHQQDEVHEDRVKRARAVRFLEHLVEIGDDEIDPEFVEQLRQQNRRLDEIQEIDEKLEQIRSLNQGNAVSDAEALGLQRRKARLKAALAEPPSQLPAFMEKVTRESLQLLTSLFWAFLGIAFFLNGGELVGGFLAFIALVGLVDIGKGWARAWPKKSSQRPPVNTQAYSKFSDPAQILIAEQRR